MAAALVAVRERTGASIEIPGAASGETVFVHLGSGPARDIISLLVYGTQFDYIFEVADDDPDTLRRVVLTAEGGSDSMTNVVVAGATDTGEGSPFEIPAPGAATHRGGGDGRARPGVRMMPGWAGPSMPSFQVDAEALTSEQAAAQDSGAAPDSAVVQDSPAQESA